MFGEPMKKSKYSITGVFAFFIISSDPAAAQFYLKHYDYADAAANNSTAGLGQSLAGATLAENNAAMVWTMRSALNVAALQCQFEPTLLTQVNYNAMLIDHEAELKAAWTTLSGYFARTNKSVRAGQDALDKFGTRTYSSFATVSSQFGFCRTAGTVSRDIVFAPRGQLATIASIRMQELRNSLVPRGEQRFAYRLGLDAAALPRLDPACWDKGSRWRSQVCGSNPWMTNSNK